MKENIQFQSRSILSQVSLGLVGLASITWLLERMAGVLIPFVFAIFLYYNVLPVMNVLNRYFPRLRHWQTVGLALLFYGVLYLLIFWLVAANVKTAIDSAGLYQERVMAFNTHLAEKMATFGISISGEQLRAAVKNSQLFNWLTDLSGGFAGLLGNLGLVLIILLFILASPMKKRRPILEDIQRQLIRYILAKTAVSLVTGISVGVCLALFGVDMASLFGLLTFLLNYVPNIGSLVSVVLPIPVALLQFGFGPHFVLAMAVPATLQFVIGTAIEPRLLGNTLDLHPITVLLALMYWGLVWGVTGMFLAVPIIVVMKIVFSHFDRTQHLSHWMAGRF